MNPNTKDALMAIGKGLCEGLACIGFAAVFVIVMMLWVTP